jgi:glyoxylase-like metal-dependent hydrolase (beta-lactamase superfamily II)
MICSLKDKEFEIIKFSNKLYLISVVPPIVGFEEFICIWLYKGEKTFIIDVGPAVTSSFLINALKKLEVNRLDYICLTHIHMDHAGGIGEIAEYYKDTPIICHRDGISHLVDPERLVKGSIKILGETGRIYGPMQPVGQKRFIEADKFTSELIHPIITPGHSSHHVSYLVENYIFAGEAGGVFLSPVPGKKYLRPATPPRFFMEIYINSLDKLIKSKADIICYGHFGMAKGAVELLKQHREQMFLWHNIISTRFSESKSDDYIENLTKQLLETDSLLECFHQLKEEVKEREKKFIKNTIMGFTQFFLSNKGCMIGSTKKNTKEN